MSSSPSATALAIKPSELFREKAVARYYVAADNCFESPAELDILDTSSRSQHSFVPRSGADTALNAFAQLATLRLNASRSFISLIDSTHQYVLAEATRTLSSQSDSTHNLDDALLVGSAVVPRESLFCGRIGTTVGDRKHAELPPKTSQPDCTIINDLFTSDIFKQHPWVSGPPFLRFYAAVPLITSDGHNVGSYCILSSSERNGLSQEEEQFLIDMSTTVMGHLESLRIRAENARQEKLVRGLESFIDGFSDIKTVQDGIGARSSNSSKRSAQKNQVTVKEEVKQAESEDNSSSWEMSLPHGARKLFSRASNILRQSSGFDGVVYFHMSSEHYSNSASAKNRKSGNVSGNSAGKTKGVHDLQISLQDQLKESSQDQSDLSTMSDGVDNDMAQKPNAVLGYSTRSGNDESSLRVTNRELEKVIGKRIKGRTLALSKAGPVLPGDTSSAASGTDYELNHSQAASSPRRATTARLAILQKLDPLAKSFAIQPLWDFEQQRWFALCVCWTRTVSRDLSSDMPFLRIFSNLTIYSLSHLNAIQSDKAKTTFISNISHELRSPLHGILGGANILSDGSLDHFQQEMLDSITSCGRTLDDTLTDLLEFSKINSTDSSKNKSMRLKASKHTTPQQAGSQMVLATLKPVDIALVVEEAVEAVLLGWTFRKDLIHRENNGSTFSFNIEPRAGPKAEKADEHLSRGSIRIILDIPTTAVGKFQTSPGMWRRFVLILVSNSMKYTRSGTIAVSLKVTEIDDNQNLCKVSLIVIDTGCGISQEFKHKHLFRPYAQEDPLSSGTGLGLSIIDSLVKRAGGKLEVSSEKDVGTEIHVGVTMQKSSTLKVPDDELEQSELKHNRMRLHDLRVCVLTCTDRSFPLSEAAQTHEEQYVTKLSKCIKDWFEIEVEVRSTWQPGSADLVICSECSFKVLADIRSTSIAGKMPPILFVAYDVIEVSALRADARILSTESIVEVTSQPCGPRKLGKVLVKMLDRQSEESERLLKSPKLQVTSLKLLDTSPKPLEKSTPTKPIRPAMPSRTSTNRSITSYSTSPIDDAVLASTRNTPPILVVDDNPINRRLLMSFIRKKHLQCETAEDGQQAVNAYKKARGRFLCVLMDISMPIMDGNAATRNIRRYESQEGLPRSKVIALTGLASATSRYEAQEAGIDRYFTKPVSFPQLGDILEEMLDDHEGTAGSSDKMDVDHER